MGESGKDIPHSRSMFRDVPAVEFQTFLADANGRMRIHRFEGALRPVGVFAKQAVEIIVNRQNELCGCGDPLAVVRASRHSSVRALDRRIALVRHESGWLAVTGGHNAFFAVELSALSYNCWFDPTDSTALRFKVVWLHE